MSKSFSHLTAPETNSKPVPNAFISSPTVSPPPILFSFPFPNNPCQILNSQTTIQSTIDASFESRASGYTTPTITVSLLPLLHYRLSPT